MRVRFVFMPEADSGVEETADDRLIPRVFAPRDFQRAVRLAFRRVERVDFIGVVDHDIDAEHPHQPRRAVHVELPSAGQEGPFSVAGKGVALNRDILDSGIGGVEVFRLFRPRSRLDGEISGDRFFRQF
ncbi:hypothetical protein SDC9_188839 [bioreactor metagenome]|uniref:Uncharacterized protein n=1 Tax=bioreactor metagenome TaxID=1076179 RepID=A0A645HRS0_9ZZZZ